MKLIIVDDHSLFRSALVHLFNSQPDFEVVGEAGTIKETLALADMYQPDLLLMDVGLPDGSGLDAITKLRHKKPDVHIVFLTVHSSDESVFSALRQGAKGFLMKDIAAPALLTALRGLQRGELAVSRRTLSRYVDELMPLQPIRASDKYGIEVTLTNREIEVLTGLAAGQSNNQMAEHLSISENTIKIHVHNILHKLKLQSRQEAAAYARRHGLMTYRAPVNLMNDTMSE
jgi:two-component system, NarL family, nitrate/nitrite response regulator NarL